MKAVLHFFQDNGTFEATHEIEIPEKFTEVKIIVGSLCDLGAVVRILPIPRPKAKVPKWRWVIPTKKGTAHTIVGPLTEEEVHRYYPNQMWYHRIDETMVEVEE